MADPHTTDAFRELVSRGLIATTPAPQPLARGNRDRRDAGRRSSWLVTLPGGDRARLLLGPDLGPRAAQQAAFHRACPSLVPAPLFHEKLTDGEAFAEIFFDGSSLDAADQPPFPAEMVRVTFGDICAALAATGVSSTAAARKMEWQAWTARVLASSAFTPGEKPLLGERILPALYAELSRAPAATRWTNGDFFADNILLSPAGDARLIDAEFAVATHFFPEDAVRFHVLSPIARRQPDWFVALPDPGPAWHLFFWLRQFVLEAAGNHADYLARVRPVRLATIRRLAEQLFGFPLEDWPVAATVIHSAVEVARWDQAEHRALWFAGWCYVAEAAALRAVVALAGGRRVAEAAPEPRPDVAQHFGGEARALRSGFTLSIPAAEADTKLCLAAVTDDGTLLPFHSCRAGDLPGRGPAVSDFTAWAEVFDPDPPAPTTAGTGGSLFSILLPVFNPPLPFLRACLDSVRGQHHGRWELCVVDDASTAAGVQEMLRESAASDRRIRVQTRATNGGIAQATNDALQTAGGEFAVLLDHDDVLRPHALAEIAARLAREPDLDVVYSDEDKISPDGRRLLPFLKPDYSPEFALGVMYIGHALCVRTAIARTAGGFDSAFDGIQDYEFFLRVTERTRRIAHLPRILYHWRQSPGSSALHGNVKGDMDAKQAAAVEAHLRRTGRTEQALALGGHRVRLQSSITPTVEIVTPRAGEDALAALRRAATASAADVLVLQFTPPQTPGADWMRELAAVAARPDSGAVAPLLLSREGQVFESGWTVGPDGSGPLMRGFDAGGDGYNGSLCCTREVAAVSSLCVALRRQLALDLPAGGGWLEFCAALRARGLFNRVCPAARVTVDNPSRATPETAPALPDPFFNPHFDRTTGDYRLRTDRPAPAPCWHLDTPAPDATSNGCFHWRGWCFWGGNEVRAIRLTIPGRLTWSAQSGLVREDVAQKFPRAPADCGFELRLRLPAGNYEFNFEAIGRDGRAWPLFRHEAQVSPWRRLGFIFDGTTEELIPFQFLAGPSGLPQPFSPREIAPPRNPAATQPRFAIVTPSYQQASFLEQCLTSVLEQRGVACEYVVQDGGSSDGSVALIQRHASRLHAWESAADAGQADAIRRGFAKTAGRPGDIMAWLNSDDLYLPGALARVADYFAKNPAVDVVYGHRVVLDEHGRQIGRWVMPAHDDAVLRLNDFIPQETLFWRRRLWDQVGGVDATHQFALDWDLLLRFQAAGARMVRLPLYLGCFRVHSAQKTSRAIHTVGRAEIDALRMRANGRRISPRELVADPRLRDYLRRSARLEWWEGLLRGGAR